MDPSKANKPTATLAWAGIALTLAWADATAREPPEPLALPPVQWLGAHMTSPIRPLPSARGGQPPYRYAVRCSPRTLDAMGYRLVADVEGPRIVTNSASVEGTATCHLQATDAAGNVAERPFHLTALGWDVPDAMRGGCVQGSSTALCQQAELLEMKHRPDCRKPPPAPASPEESPPRHAAREARETAAWLAYGRCLYERLTPREGLEQGLEQTLRMEKRHDEQAAIANAHARRIQNAMGVSDAAIAQMLIGGPPPEEEKLSGCQKRRPAPVRIATSQYESTCAASPGRPLSASQRGRHWVCTTPPVAIDPEGRWVDVRPLSGCGLAFWDVSRAGGGDTRGDPKPKHIATIIRWTWELDDNPAERPLFGPLLRSTDARVMNQELQSDRTKAHDEQAKIRPDLPDEETQAAPPARDPGALAPIPSDDELRKLSEVSKLTFADPEMAKRREKDRGQEPGFPRVISRLNPDPSGTGRRCPSNDLSNDWPYSCGLGRGIAREQALGGKGWGYAHPEHIAGWRDAFSPKREAYFAVRKLIAILKPGNAPAQRTFGIAIGDREWNADAPSSRGRRIRCALRGRAPPPWPSLNREGQGDVYCGHPLFDVDPIRWLAEWKRERAAACFTEQAVKAGPDTTRPWQRPRCNRPMHRLHARAALGMAPQWAQWRMGTDPTNASTTDHLKRTYAEEIAWVGTQEQSSAEIRASLRALGAMTSEGQEVARAQAGCELEVRLECITHVETLPSTPGRPPPKSRRPIVTPEPWRMPETIRHACIENTLHSSAWCAEAGIAR